MFEDIVFKNLWILTLIPFAVAGIWYRQNTARSPSLRFSSTCVVAGIGPTWKLHAERALDLLRVIIVALFIIALAGPRSVSEETIVKSDGIAIALAIDASGSMAAEDFVIDRSRVNRLDITKRVVDEFIDNRSFDQIGLIAFGGLAYTVCPLTTDYNWLRENLRRIELGLIDDGTAIGSAIMSAVSRLRDVEAKSRIIILLTDGVNNRGEILPLDAAKVAQRYGIKIYTIGAGTKGYVPYPSTDFFGRRTYRKVIIELDEESLRRIADMTGGQYFYAGNTEALRDIYQEIDRLEKSKIEQIGYRKYEELFVHVLSLALVLLLFEVMMRNSLLLRIP